MIAGIPIIVLLLLLIFPQISVAGAAEGLSLWFHTVLPTLSPFMICTRLISSMGGIPLLMRPISPLFQMLFGLSEPGSYILCCGLLCGYPLGAGLCAQFLQEGRISGEEAQTLLAICNHPSPVFLTGYILSLLTVQVPVSLILFCFYFPILPVSVIARRIYRPAGTSCEGLMDRPAETAQENPLSPASARRQCPDESSAKGITDAPPRISGASIEQILTDTSETMVLIGNYIMLFSILSRWIRQLPFLTPRLCALCAGFAEITTGTRQICETFPGKDALLPVLMATAFGGLSGIFQTRGVILRCQKPETCRDNTKNTGIPDGTSRTNDAGLSVRHYIGFQILHALLTSVCVMALT